MWDKDLLTFSPRFSLSGRRHNGGMKEPSALDHEEDSDETHTFGGAINGTLRRRLEPGNVRAFRSAKWRQRKGRSVAVDRAGKNFNRLPQPACPQPGG